MTLLTTIAAYVAFEAVVLYTLRSVHAAQLVRMTSGNPARKFWWPAALAYYLLAPGALHYLALKNSRTVREAVMRGAVLGAAMYAAYDLTLLAVLGPDLVPVWYAALDMAAGTLSVAGVSWMVARWVLRLP